MPTLADSAALCETVCEVFNSLWVGVIETVHNTARTPIFEVVGTGGDEHVKDFGRGIAYLARATGKIEC
jgi:hypothetical protein